MKKYGAVREAIDDNIIRRMRFACCITKGTHARTRTHTHYVILNAFPRQQWLRERASVLHYTYIACLVELDVLFYITLHYTTLHYITLHYHTQFNDNGVPISSIFI